MYGKKIIKDIFWKLWKDYRINQFLIRNKLQDSEKIMNIIITKNSI